MSSDLRAAIRQVTRLREDLASRTAGPALLAEIEAVLTEGYARALAGDARASGCERRLRELIDGAGAVSGRELRAAGTEYARLQRDLVELRSELAELWRARDRLHERAPGLIVSRSR